MPNFTRKIEDFTCGHCGAKVKGNGYTNHCPACLWSKHVDINPGDRLAKCGGLMEPVKVEMDHGQYILMHKCQTCGQQKRNKTVQEDSFEAILALAKAS